MRRRTEQRPRGQANPAEGPAREVLRQMLLPMVDGFLATREALHGVVQQAGLAVIKEFFQAEAERVVGPKARHQKDREMHFWGTAPTEFALGGRKVTLPRPRVRHRDRGEIRLERIEQLRRIDSLPESVIDKILVGVSTRNYDRSLEPCPTGLRSRGTSKSAASRHVVRETGARLKDFVGRRLDGLDVLVLMLDGLNIGEHTVVVALGIASDGTKHPLGLVNGSTENATICTNLLQDLLSRGLSISGKLLCVIDGGKGLRKAVIDVFGENALIQRCQIHKMRNVRDHLAKKRQAHVLHVMRDAYASGSSTTARKRLQALISWLEGHGEDEAAASLREGLDETLAILKLNLTPSLRRSLSTTNAIENLMGSVRRTTRNIKRWKNSAMARRWVGLAIAAAEEKFRRIKGHKDIGVLAAFLRRSSSNDSVEQKAVAA